MSELKVWVLYLVHASMVVASSRSALSVVDFGAKADGITNNQQAIMRAMTVCEEKGGCELHFPLPPAGKLVRVSTVPSAQQPYGPPVVAVYMTSAFNLTSHLKMVIPAGVQLHGTENAVDNCGGTNTSSCDSLDSPAWPVLPWPAYPSHPNRAGDSTPSKQAFIRGYNLTDVEISGGGEINAGGGWWWCVRMAAAGQPGGFHAPKWCPQMLKVGQIPGFTLVPPRMLHLIGSESITLQNMSAFFDTFSVYHFLRRRTHAVAGSFMHWDML